jgi:hypothetical protein
VVSRAELARLLEQAELIDLERPQPGVLPETVISSARNDTHVATRIQRWLFAMRNPAKSRT